MSSSKPYVIITEQPAGKSQRFRYLSEVDGARSVGSIPGVSSTSERRTYPTIRVHGHNGPFVVLLSLLNPHNNLVHPHSITGSDPRYTCRHGVVFVISDEPEVVFKNIGILCVKGKTEKDVKSALKSRKEMNIDPFGAGFSHIYDHRQINFTAVRLCFQVFLPGPNWTPADRMDLLKYDRGLAPVASDVVYDAKKLNDLKIVHITSHAGPLTGGAEMTLLCDKYTGQNPDVVFDDGRGWSHTATAKIYHKQLAIVFTAPPYREERDPRSPDYLQVQVYLQQCSERGVLRSQPATVKYIFSEKNSTLLFPKQTPPGYLADIYAKGKGRAKTSTKTSDSCAMPSTSSQVPSFSPYQNIKISSASYQEFSASVQETDFSAITGHDQYVNNGSSYRPLNPSNIPGNDMISILNNIQGNNMALSNMNNIHENNMIPNIHAEVDTRVANTNLKATVLPEVNVTPGSYIFSARIPAGTKVKRSVSEHNRGKADSDELSPKREKVMTPEYLGCDASPAYINSNNQFHSSNMQIQNDGVPTSGEERVIQTIINDILTDPCSKGIFDAVFNNVYAVEAWHENINLSMTADLNNINQNNLDPNNIGHRIHNDEISINENYNLNEITTHSFMPNNIGHNQDMNNGDCQHNVVEIDFENALSADLKRGLNVSE
ncbi:transcription factor p65-like isoform X1 [Cydia pomonella]|uniref:transcription factor p65-like isoform X1 n=1 Tax=Cydia pomonella TaxID=82600 RepID=UPI002ADE5C5C|nr:transcription factor p65-like isoform X1 [Cydia pomonella]